MRLPDLQENYNSGWTLFENLIYRIKIKQSLNKNLQKKSFMKVNINHLLYFISSKVQVATEPILQLKSLLPESKNDLFFWAIWPNTSDWQHSKLLSFLFNWHLLGDCLTKSKYQIVILSLFIFGGENQS